MNNEIKYFEVWHESDTVGKLKRAGLNVIQLQDVPIRLENVKVNGIPARHIEVCRLHEDYFIKSKFEVELPSNLDNCDDLAITCNITVIA